MPQTIESLIKLAETDRDIQKYIFEKSHLERQIDTARSVVDQHQKTIVQKKDEFDLLSSECKDVNNNLQNQEDLISRLDSQVPRIRNEKEFATSKNQLEEARKILGLLEDKMLDLDLKKEDLEKEIETMAPLYSDDIHRIKNMRLKIIEALEDKKMIGSIEDLIKKL